MGDKFEDLAKEVSEKASRIDCPIPDYIDGLKAIIGHLELDIEAAKESL